MVKVLLKNHNNNKNLLQLIGQDMRYVDLLDIMIQWLMHFQLWMVMFLPLIKRQSCVLKRISGRQLWEEEMHSLQKNETWGFAQLPKGKKKLGANGYL